MISSKFFLGSKELHVDSYANLIALCASIRKEDKITPYTIYIDKEGIERGNLKFPFSNFHVIARGKRLVSSLYAKMKDDKGEELTTWKTAALKVTGSHNIFENLFIENDAGSPETKGQEVALGVYGDDNIFSDCTLVSTQDTLFVGPLPDDLCTRYIDFLPQDERYFDGNASNYFSHCAIKGSVDFIFGAGRAVFDNCNLVTIADKRGESYVVAPSHSLKDDFGYLFYQCRFSCEKGVEEKTIFLARPWRDYGKAVFAYCNYGSHISSLGFHDWSDVDRKRTARFEEYPFKEGRVDWIHNKTEDVLPSRYTDAVLALRKSLSD